MPRNWLFLVTQKLQTAPDLNYPHSKSFPEEIRRNPRGGVEYIFEIGDESRTLTEMEGISFHDCVPPQRVVHTG